MSRLSTPAPFGSSRASDPNGPDLWWLPVPLLAVWFGGIAWLTVEVGLWWGIAFWLGFPVLVVVALVGTVAFLQRLEHNARRSTLPRHPSMYGRP